MGIRDSADSAPATTEELLRALSEPSAYAHDPDSVEVEQTHISLVFLAGESVFKVKKPVDFGFLDFSTSERRQHFCGEEVRLNRRLSHGVYRGVVPVLRLSDDRIVMGEPDEAIPDGATIVEHAVHMRRLPHEARLLERLRAGPVAPDVFRELAARLAHYHARAERSPATVASGRFENVAAKLRDNVARASEELDHTVTASVAERVIALQEATLARLGPLIDARADRGVTCDTHGDLRLDHIYLFPDHPPPEDLQIVDCIEFSEPLRYQDPIADLAFLVMELEFRGFPELARVTVESYLTASGDTDGAQLLSLYIGYRALVRAKVEALTARETEVPADERARAVRRATAYWLLALATLEDPARRPCLLLVAGLPGTGKSTVAVALAQAGRCTVVRADVVRKELAGLPPEQPARGELDTGIYTPEHTERTVAACAEQAAERLQNGERVIIDSTLPTRARRERFLAVARELAVPAGILVTELDREETCARIAARTGDASDANVSVYEVIARRWEALAPDEASGRHAVIPTAEPDAALAAARTALETWGLL